LFAGGRGRWALGGKWGRAGAGKSVSRSIFSRMIYDPVNK